ARIHRRGGLVPYVRSRRPRRTRLLPRGRAHGRYHLERCGEALVNRSRKGYPRLSVGAGCGMHRRFARTLRTNSGSRGDAERVRLYGGILTRSHRRVPARPSRLVETAPAVYHGAGGTQDFGETLEDLAAIAQPGGGR